MSQTDTEADNQPPPFEDLNLYSSDAALQDAVSREGGGHAVRSLVAFGLVCGSADAVERARLANTHAPRLETHDAEGRRIDTVEFHPAYHELMEISCAEGLNCAAWLHQVKKTVEAQPDQQVARAAGLYLATQMEPGHICPISMTHASVPTLNRAPKVAETWLPRVVSRSYDARREPIEDKRAATIGMGMTERQGGSDVLANTTAAEPVTGEQESGLHRLNGHKWFLSAPMSDAFIVLAQTGEGPGRFWCRGLHRKESLTVSTCCASRTSSVTARMPPPKPNCMAVWAG